MIGLLKFFYVQRIRGFDTPSEPSLDPKTLDRLKAELGKAKRYLEFGCGGSTILADRMGVQTISIESDPYYAKAVRKALNGNAEIAVANIGLTGPWGWPLFTRPTPRRRELWRGYVCSPFKLYGTEFPDLILIDGRFRVACAMEAARMAWHFRRTRSTLPTLIIDDYAHRPHYQVVEQWLGEPEMVGRAAVFSIGAHEVPAPVELDPA